MTYAVINQLDFPPCFPKMIYSHFVPSRSAPSFFSPLCLSLTQLVLRN